MGLDLSDLELLVLGAVLARRTYGMSLDLKEYSFSHKIDGVEMQTAVEALNDRHDKPLLIKNYDGLFEITEFGFERALPEIHRLKALVNRKGDVISQMAFGLIAGLEGASEESIGAKAVAVVEKKRKFKEEMGSDTHRAAFIRMLRNAYENIERHTSNNTEIAQAKAYIESAIILIECPEPQPDIVWDIMDMASNIASVATLFIAIISFIAIS